MDQIGVYRILRLRSENVQDHPRSKVAAILNNNRVFRFYTFKFYLIKLIIGIYVNVSNMEV